jgi:hypothetical protein
VDSRFVGDLAMLPEAWLIDYLAPKLIDSNLEDAIHLMDAAHHNYLYPYFERNLANKLLQLLNDVACVTTPNLQVKMQQIELLMNLYPSLMFVQVSGTTPLKNILAGLDIYFQHLFYIVAERINKLDEFDKEMLSQQVADDNLCPLYDKISDEFNPANYADGEIETWPEALQILYREELETFCKTVIGQTQAKLERCLFDDLMNNQSRTGEDDYNYVHYIPAQSYTAVGNDSSSYDLADTNSNKKLGVDFCLEVDNDGKIKAVERLNSTIYSSNQRDIWAGFFNDRLQWKMNKKMQSMDRKLQRDAIELENQFEQAQQAMQPPAMN